VLKIAGKTYTSILVLLFGSEEDLVLLVMPRFAQIAAFESKIILFVVSEQFFRSYAANLCKSS
jgi:hypothetical protein